MGFFHCNRRFWGGVAFALAFFGAGWILHGSSSAAFAADPTAGNATPGSANYPALGLQAYGAFAGNVDSYGSGAFDALHGYAYLFSEGGMLDKIAVDFSGSTPTLKARIAVGSGLRLPAIDAQNGFLFAIAGSQPCVLFKFAAGAGNAPPALAGQCTLGSFSDAPAALRLDPDAGYGYCLIPSASGVLIKFALGSGAAAPSVVASTTFGLSEPFPASLVLDAANGYAYLGTNQLPAFIMKAALGAGNAAPYRVGAIALPFTEQRLARAFIDPAGGYAYFVTNNFPAYLPNRLVKVALGNGSDLPRRASSMPFEFDDIGIASQTDPAVDAAAGLAYLPATVNSGSGPSISGAVIKIALGDGDTTPTRLLRSPLPRQMGLSPCLAGIVPVSGFGWFSTIHSPGQLLAMDLGGSDSSLEPITLFQNDSLEASINGPGAVNPADGYAWFATNRAVIAKAAFDGNSASIREVGSASTFAAPPAALRSVNSILIDSLHGYGYLATVRSTGAATDPGATVAKFALGSGDLRPRYVGSATLSDGSNTFGPSWIDPAGSFAYYMSNALMFKLDFGSGDTAPAFAPAIDLGVTPNAGVIDPANGIGYFAISNFPAKIAVISSGATGSPPSKIGELATPAYGLTSAAIDAVHGYAYFGSPGNNSGLAPIPPLVVKVKLSREFGMASIAGIATGFFSDTIGPSALIDPALGVGWFGWPGGFVKFNLGAGSALPFRIGAVDIPDLTGAPVYDPATGQAGYFQSTGGSPVYYAYALTQKGFVKMTRLTMPGVGVVKSVSFYSHAAAGNLRLGLYREDSATKRTLVWQSASIPDNAAGNFVTIPASAGTPHSLTLAPGSYFLAWQTDSTADVASYSSGPAGAGAFATQPYGDFPAQLDNASPTTGWTSTGEVWTGYLTYQTKNGVPREAWAGY